MAFQETISLSGILSNKARAVLRSLFLTYPVNITFQENKSLSGILSNKSLARSNL
jgi:hypothetical protein